MTRALVKALIVLAVGAFLFVRCNSGTGPERLSLDGKTMGTSWNVQLFSSRNEAELQSLGTEIGLLLQELDKKIFSTYAEQSELSRLNQSGPGQALPLSADMQTVLLAAAQIHAASEHAFDITVAPLVNLWGFGPQRADSALPSAQAIAAALARLGMDKLQLDESAGTLTKLHPVQLDLSGIAKGYAVDRVAALLQAQGEENFLVEIGGEVRVQGWRSTGQGWKLALETPAADTRSAFATIYSKGQSLALAGSGDYRNFRLIDGKRYAHEIDPRSGYPVQHQLAAVTVVAESCMLADAWATALMVLGPEAGRELADRLHLAAYFIMHEDMGTESSDEAAEVRSDKRLSSTHTPGFATYLAAPESLEVPESFP